MRWAAGTDLAAGRSADRLELIRPTLSDEGGAAADAHNGPVTDDHDSQTWQTIGSAKFVSLGTYRKSGELVSTAVWIAPEGGDLVVTSERSTGKVKRLRRDDRVLMQPCSRFGDIEPDAPVGFGHAVVNGHDDRSAVEALRAKYGLQFALFLRAEAVMRRLRRNDKERVILRITQAEPA